MGELFYQLGVNWRLLVSQGVNFLILLLALTFVAYKPLLELMDDRKKRIEIGLRGAEEAERRLSEIEKIKSAAIAEAEAKALKIIGDSEKTAGLRSREIVQEAGKKAEEALKEAAEIAEKRKFEELEILKKESAGLIREAIARTIELDPSAIDEKLIGKALEKLSANEI